MAKKRSSKSNAVAELGQRILSALDEQCAQGNVRPVSLRELAAEIQPDLSETDLMSALQAKPLKDAVVTAFADDCDSLMVRKENLEHLAADDGLLQLLLSRQCSPERPHVSLTVLKPLLNKPVQAAFVRAWTERIRQQQLPDFVQVVSVRSDAKAAKPELHDIRFPLPWIELSKKLVATTQQLTSESNTSTALSGQVFADSHADANEELTGTAVVSEPFCSAVRILRVSGDQQHLIMTTDIDRVLQSENLLQTLLHDVSSADKPEVKLSELARLLSKDLQLAFRQHWQDTLTTTSELRFAEVARKTATDLNLRDSRFPRPEVDLSCRLVEAVRTLTTAEDTSAPVTISAVLELVKADSESARLLKAARLIAPFASDVRTVRTANGNEWVSLTVDAEKAVSCEAFLKTMLSEVCTTDKPEVKLSELARQLPKDLQSRFNDIWRTHLELRRTFASVELSASTRNDVLLRDARFPRREVQLSKKLVQTLESLKARGSDFYPCTFSELMEHVGPEAGILLANAAVTVEPYRSKVMAAFPAAANSPIAFLSDAEQLANSPTLILAVLPSVLKPDQQAIAVDILAKTKGLNAMVQPFVAAAVGQMIASRKLPEGVGALQITKKWHLFRLKDVVQAKNVTPMELTSTAAKPVGDQSPT